MLLLPSGDSLALEQVVDKLRTAHRLSFVVEMYSGTPARQVSKTRVYMMDSGQMRSEWESPQGKTVMIADGDSRLQLSPATKTAIVAKMRPMDVGNERKALQELRSLVEGDGRPLGEKIVGGIRAKGFEATKKGRKITLWADVRNGVPVRIEFPHTEVPPPHGPIMQVLSDFTFPSEFDPELFNLAVPAGYKVEQFQSLKASPMDDMVAVLRLYAKRSGGAFPATFEPNGRTIATALGMPDDAETQAVTEAATKAHPGLMIFLKSGEKGRDYQYYSGTRMGEKDRLVFWCADPPITATFIPLIPHANSSPHPRPAPDKFLAVYGDLHVEKLRKDQLPPAEPAQRNSVESK
ncbi:MAG: hypothetical protein WDZ48_04645 [Pirellulales bacterium]